MKLQRDPRIIVNVCWQIKNEKKCVALPREEAYATRKWVEENNGVIFWFDPIG